MMSVVEAASREGDGVGAVTGGPNMQPFSPSRVTPSLDVGDVGRQRRRAEGASSMADHPGRGRMRPAIWSQSDPKRSSAVPSGPFMVQPRSGVVAP
jgi:hypothetical protein